MSTSAKIRITLEVEASSSWSRETTTGQVFDQAGKETTNRVVSVLTAAGIRARVQDCEVLVVTHSEKTR